MKDMHTSSGPKAKQAKLTSRTPDQVVKPFRKTTGFADLPPEIHLMIWEMAIDLPPSVVTIGATLKHNYGQRDADRQIDIKNPDTNKFNRWQWAQKMAEEFLYAQKAVLKTFGTRQECRNPLNTVRRNKDIALYLFKSSIYQNYSWHTKMNIKHNRKYMGPGVEHVGILWDRTKTNAFWCYEASHCLDNVKLCPSELYHFLDHFDSVKHVYIHVIIKTSDTHCRSKAGLVYKMGKLIEGQKTKRPDLLRFEDSDRIWIEVDRPIAKRFLKDSIVSLFDIISNVRGRILRRYTKTDNSFKVMDQIKFHVLVASYFKDVVERP
ncbi:hypothetical protein F5X68DRAFT_236774 [Plectosphaerella plurivora]|uniref:2EXR domain-containing protein n=1 Tax=Plectosphaerella plurivora TaxID=936078 RepID=A0A9P8V2V3_9PEZI|nr:hypothetical protein F5X68DRAFT_236774 [Plectosphaerella plurivora]